jgi:3-hydroxybutyryl-CoA dehydrogenase
MKVLVTGDTDRMREMRGKLKSSKDVDYVELEEMPDVELDEYDIIIDLNADESGLFYEQYVELEDKIIILSAAQQSLAEMVFVAGDAPQSMLIGINALPGFLSLPKMEVSLYHKQDEKRLKEIFGQMGWEYHLVDDRIGMISARIIFMIINEACYTLQEGTATAEDIDESMKLGTNYPFGPFEWCDRVGVHNVYETLEALYQDTHDERYKVCPLLKSKYLRDERFYPLHASHVN